MSKSKKDGSESIDIVCKSTQDSLNGPVIVERITENRETTMVSPKTEKKLSKKERKAKEFRAKKKGKENHNEEIKVPPQVATENSMAEKSKKREREHEDRTKKTNNSSQKVKKQKIEKTSKKKVRFILFVGNLPHSCTQEDILKHFEAASPSVVRVRKGYAFLEFSGNQASSQLNTALRYHHTTMQGRKINVELTVGGGGNSENRRQKLKEKNDQLQEERASRISKEEEEQREKDRTLGRKNNNSNNKADEKGANTSITSKPVQESTVNSIHPSRLKLLRQSK